MIKNITIVGGGSAGWMSAATLIKCFPDKNITLIESPKVPTIGVGESTLAFINDWLMMLGIKDEDFMKACDATYKLSIRFENFYKIGDKGFHYPFGDPVYSGSMAGLNDWFFKKFIYPETPNYDYCDSVFPVMQLINTNRLTDDSKLLPRWSFKKHAAYHFDATKFGEWLKTHYCKPKGVKHIKAHISSVEQDEDGIKSLNKKYKADLFIDCTGQQSLLLGKALKEPFNSIPYLPNNSAWATKVPYTNKPKQIFNYTNCTAIENGWVWKIPLWSRIGTGYVYSDKYISDAAALKQFKKHLGKGADKLEFRNLKFRVGMHENIWVKNVCAIGLSTGFIEPLEGNGLFAVHEYLNNLVRCLDQRDSITDYIRSSFNFVCKKQTKAFTEFVGLHYALTARDDTPYWRDVQKRKYPFDFSNAKLDSDFQRNALAKFEKFHYEEGSGYHCIATGMNWYPTDVGSLVRGQFQSKGDLIIQWHTSLFRMKDLRMRWKNAIRNCERTFHFLRRKIYETK